MKNFIIILLVLFSSCVFSAQKADSVLVNKSEKKLYLIADGKPFKSYHVVFGANPEGHKQQEGDERTPEGKYLLDYKKEDSAFYKAIHISYPNQHDIESAKKRGVNPGGLIMIHGQPNGLGWLSFASQFFNWTNGCIAVTNSEMDEIWQAVDVGVPVEIVQ
ncbi:L,D-transpeptidase family protein [Shewanella cutis]|uniref:L,D-transpeptidase family protein n=1 Tax=Shewanella cutis TaxID=2766780 RepID=A0ABS9QZB8_9GAMM|nr:L,D-transpeptidase family protein [Shewanella sp. PS-2]